MSGAVEIKMTSRGYDVTIGDRTVSFARVDQALDFVEQRLARAAELRELSNRCE